MLILERTRPQRVAVGTASTIFYLNLLDRFYRFNLLSGINPFNRFNALNVDLRSLMPPVHRN